MKAKLFFLSLLLCSVIRAQIAPGVGAQGAYSGTVNGTAAPSGAAGGVLSGTYPSPGFGTFTSATLLAAISNATGTGTAVFNTGPTLVTPILGVASATSINPTSGVFGISGSSSASAGINGETITQGRLRGSAVSLSNGTPANVTATALVIPSSGHWRVYGDMGLTGSSAAVTDARVSINTTSATINTFDSGLTLVFPNTSVLTTDDLIVPFYFEVTTTTSTTYYLVAQAAFGAGTVAAYGNYTAVRSY